MKSKVTPWSPAQGSFSSGSLCDNIHINQGSQHLSSNFTPSFTLCGLGPDRYPSGPHYPCQINGDDRVCVLRVEGGFTVAGSKERLCEVNP